MSSVYVFKSELDEVKEMLQFGLNAFEKLANTSDKLVNIIKENINGLPLKNIPVDLLEKKAEQWFVVDDDLTGKVDERLFVKWPNEAQSLVLDFKDVSDFSFKNFFTSVSQKDKDVIEIPSPVASFLEEGIKVANKKEISQSEVAVIGKALQNLDYVVKLEGIVELIANNDLTLAKEQLNTLQLDVVKDVRNSHKDYQEALNEDFKKPNGAQKKGEVELVEVGVTIVTEPIPLKDFKLKDLNHAKTAFQASESLSNIVQKLVNNLMNTQNLPFKPLENTHSLVMNRGMELER